MGVGRYRAVATAWSASLARHHATASSRRAKVADGWGGGEIQSMAVITPRWTAEAVTNAPPRQ
ncbi:MAG: hypothetical protein JOZ69_19530 [Myxococcales bacterium]|nr:hypothetical protein [Myxococcales bacterium]